MEFTEYHKMRNEGLGASDVYAAAVKAGMREIDRIRMIRTVFNLSLREAKEVIVVASGHEQSLSAHQRALKNSFERVLENDIQNRDGLSKE